ncbi:hypothetical protein H0H92_003039 [Tricholoma furcatifolium]|nr:hypothetical protein H0H92_003039 [Tricholoma furcatifolium]
MVDSDVSFVDPKVEGTFTSDSRAKVHEYIQEQIKAHESIIRYYKKRQNALTVTCQIPVEVLARVFSYVVEDAVGDNAKTYTKKTDWMSTVSHICSHWREVALSTPSLWSTIDLGYDPAWALEMLQRSKNSPLSVINVGDVFKTAFPVLVHILDSHLPRIKELLVGHNPQYLFSSDRSRTSLGSDYLALLSLLGQHDSPTMEKLTMRTPLFRSSNGVMQLPDRIIMRSASLKCLILDGYGINWELSPAFEGLKVFEICHTRSSEIPHPSMIQLLRFILQVPLLETLAVQEIDSTREEMLPSNIEYLRMEYLEHLEVSCASVSIINSFFRCLALPRIVTIMVRLTPDEPPIIGTALQLLTQRLDDLTTGPVLELELDSTGIGCWKKKQRRIEEPKEPPTIEIDTCFGAPEISDILLRSLRLDQLLYLVVNDHGDDGICNSHFWTLIGTLPRLQELKVYDCPIEPILDALCYQVHPAPRSGTDTEATTQPAFPALTILEIYGWYFDSSSMDASDIWALSGCVKLRSLANLPLKRLIITDCAGVNESALACMREFVDEIDWDGLNQHTSESDEEDGLF